MVTQVSSNPCASLGSTSYLGRTIRKLNPEDGICLRPASYSIQNGLWTSTTTWLGGVIPPVEADVTIQHSVTLNTDTRVGSIRMETGGRLTVNAGRQLQVNN
jgi:hypothetical protein